MGQEILACRRRILSIVVKNWGLYSDVRGSRYLLTFSIWKLGRRNGIGSGCFIRIRWIRSHTHARAHSRSHPLSLSLSLSGFFESSNQPSGVSQEFLKRAIADYLIRCTDLFSFILRNRDNNDRSIWISCFEANTIHLLACCGILVTTLRVPWNKKD